MDIFCENCGKNLRAISEKYCEKRIQVEAISGREKTVGKCKKCDKYRVFYYKYKGQKINYRAYIQRIKKNGFDPCKAILLGDLKVKNTKRNKTGRVCTVCGKFKPRSEFHKSKASKDGHTSSCKECRLKAKRQYRATIHGRMQDYLYKRQYWTDPKNREKSKIYARIRRSRNKERIKENKIIV